MKKWMEIFKAGTHVSSSGKKKNWSVKDLDHMVSNYNAEHNAAPLVVGHPKDNHPAYGWVDQLKRVDDVLMAKTKQVEAQFADLVKEGRFSKRSIAVNPDGTLRHVGFLGAVPPAIKGLKDIEFNSDQEAITYEYSEQEAGMLTKEEEKKLREELEAAKKKIEKAEAEANKNKSASDKSKAEFAQLQKDTQRKEISDFVDAGIKNGTLLPAWKDSGIVDFMDGLESDEETFEFSEGKKETKSDWFKTFLANFSAHPLFKEMAVPEDGKKKDADEFADDEKEAEEMAANHIV